MMRCGRRCATFIDRAALWIIIRRMSRTKGLRQVGFAACLAVTIFIAAANVAAVSNVPAPVTPGGIINKPLNEGKVERKANGDQQKAQQAQFEAASAKDQEKATSSPKGETDPDYFKKENLKIQQRMADASENAIFLTRVQFGITAAATILLLLTLFFTARSAHAATKSANAAIAGLRLSSRGYLNVKLVHIDRVLFRHADGTQHKSFRLTPSWENMGATPAIVTKTIIRWRTITDDDVPAIDWGEDIPGPESNTPIGPNAPVKTDPLDLDVVQAVQIFREENRFFFLVRIEYKDMFNLDAAYHTQVCFEVGVLTEPDALHDNAGADASKFITFSAVGEHSSAN